MKRKHYLLAVEKDGAVFYAQRNPDCLKGYRLVRDKAKAETFGEEIRKIWLKVYPTGSAEEVSGPIRPDRPAKAPRAPRAEKARKPKPPLKMTRKVALDLIMVAGYEGDRARATRLLIENRISKTAADEAFRRGAAKKAAEERKAAPVSEPLELAPEPSRALELASVPSGKTEIPWNEAQERDARADKKGAAIVLMDPEVFLELTTADAAQVRAIRDAAKPIDTYLSPEVQKNLLLPPFLTIDPNRDNKIVSHEGRHRAAAVLNAGGKAFKVLIRTTEEGQDLPSSMRFQFVPGKQYPLKTLKKVGSLRVVENLAKQRKERAFSSYMAEKRQRTEELAERLKKFAPGSIAIQILTGRERVFRKENVLEDSWNEIRKSAEGWEPVPGGNIYEDVILRGYRINPDAWEFIDSADPMKGDLTVEYRRIVPTPRPAEPRLSDDSMFTLVKGDDRPPAGFEPVTPEAVPTDRTRDQVRMWLTQRTGRIPALRPGMSLARYGELVTEAADKAHALMMRHGGRVFVYFKPASVSVDVPLTTEKFSANLRFAPVGTLVRWQASGESSKRVYRKMGTGKFDWKEILPGPQGWRPTSTRGERVFASIISNYNQAPAQFSIVFPSDPKAETYALEASEPLKDQKMKARLSEERELLRSEASELERLEQEKRAREAEREKMAREVDAAIKESREKESSERDRYAQMVRDEPMRDFWDQWQTWASRRNTMQHEVRAAELAKRVENYNALSGKALDVASLNAPAGFLTYANGIKTQPYLVNLPEDTIIRIEGKPAKGYKNPTNSQFILLPDGTWRRMELSGNNWQPYYPGGNTLSSLVGVMASSKPSEIYVVRPGTKEHDRYMDKARENDDVTPAVLELLREYTSGSRKKDAPKGIIRKYKGSDFHLLARALSAGLIERADKSDNEAVRLTEKGREALA
jgi:hypothetical protein